MDAFRKQRRFRARTALHALIHVRRRTLSSQSIHALVFVPCWQRVPRVLCHGAHCLCRSSQAYRVIAARRARPAHCFRRRPVAATKAPPRG